MLFFLVSGCANSWNLVLWKILGKRGGGIIQLLINKHIDDMAISGGFTKCRRAWNQLNNNVYFVKYTEWIVCGGHWAAERSPWSDRDRQHAQHWSFQVAYAIGTRNQQLTRRFGKRMLYWSRISVIRESIGANGSIRKTESSIILIRKFPPESPFSHFLSSYRWAGPHTVKAKPSFWGMPYLFWVWNKNKV